MVPLTLIYSTMNTTGTLQENHTKYPTLELCQTRIEEIDEEIQKLQTIMEDLSTRGIDTASITQKIETLTKEKEDIQTMMRYFERKRTQVGQNETRYGETIDSLSALSPTIQETAEERIKALEKIPGAERRFGRTIGILREVDNPLRKGPLQTTQKSIRELLEVFFGNDGGARAEKDRQYGLIPSETEKRLARFYREENEGTAPSYGSKEYRDLRSDWNETLQKRESQLEKDPVLRTFLESEFARITTLPTDEERRTHLQALKNFLWQGQEGKILFSDDIKRSCQRRGYDEPNYQDRRSDVISMKHRDAITHDISCRYYLIAAQPRDIEYALPSLAVIRLYRKGALEQYGITEKDIVAAAGINEIAGYWNFVGSTSSGQPQIERIGNQRKISQELRNAIAEEMRKIARELIPALNARRGQRLGEGERIIDRWDIVTSSAGLRVKAGEKPEASSIESTLPESDQINLLGATVLKNTFETEERKKEATGQQRERLATLISEMNDITARIKKIRDTIESLKIKKTWLDSTLLAQAISEIETLPKENRKLDEQLRNMGWWKRRTEKGGMQVENIKRRQEDIKKKIQNENAWIINVAQNKINQNGEYDLTGTPEDIGYLLRTTIIDEITLEINNLENEEKQLRITYQEKEKERQELLQQLKDLGVSLWPPDYQVTFLPS